MAATEKPQTVLLLLRNERAPLPFSNAGFGVSNGPKKRIAAYYLHATVLFRDGGVKRIERIEFLSYYGSTWLRRFFSAANGGTRNIAVQFSELPASLEAVKKDLIVRLQPGNEPPAENPEGAESLQILIRNIESASSMAEIFDMLELPAPQDALDSLA